MPTMTTTTTKPGRSPRNTKAAATNRTSRSTRTQSPPPPAVSGHGNGKVLVKESPIHGLGLFAKQRIRKGTIIGKIEGRLSRRDGPHVLWISDAYGIEVTNEMRYINHSDQANACYYDDATVVALRTIQPGEEITHNYDGDR